MRLACQLDGLSTPQTVLYTGCVYSRWPGMMVGVVELHVRMLDSVGAYATRMMGLLAGRLTLGAPSACMYAVMRLSCCPLTRILKPGLTYEWMCGVISRCEL